MWVSLISSKWVASACQLIVRVGSVFFSMTTPVCIDEDEGDQSFVDALKIFPVYYIFIIPVKGDVSFNHTACMSILSI